MRRAWMIGVLVLACGKGPVQQVSLAGSLDPATSDGFHRVEPGCVVPAKLAPLPASQTGSLESVAPLTHFTGRIASDDRSIYWVEGERIRRAERGALSWEWTVADVVRSEVPIDDFAVTNGHVYWTTREHDGHTALRGLGEPLVEWGAISMLVARDESVFWLTEHGLREISDHGGLRTVEHVELAATVVASAVLAADATSLYAAHSDVIVRLSRKNPAEGAALVPRGVTAIAAASDGTFLYWLERGDEAVGEPECRACTRGYEMPRPRKGAYPKGKLRRVRVVGGLPSDVATDLVDVETLTVQPATGIVWIGTARGLVHVDPAAEQPAPLAVLPDARAHGALVAFGGALALAAAGPIPRVALLSVP